MSAVEGQRLALVVAVAEYEDKRFRQLRSPSADAEALARVLADPDVGAYEVEITLNEQQHVISRKLEDFFSDRRREDVLLLHLSCHGVKDQHGDLYFAARDTVFGRLKASAVASSFLTDLMRDSRARRIFVFLDCCYSGAFSKGFVARGDDDVHVVERFAGEGRAVITASKSTEYAFEGDVLTSEKPQPSVFTTALVRGLESGDADRDRDGDISFDDLYDFVYDEVVRATTGQTPGKSVPSVVGKLYIARSRHRPELPPDLLAATTSPLAGIREGAVTELARLRAGGHPGLARAASSALEQLGRDDSARVREAAQAALQPKPPPPPPPPSLWARIRARSPRHPRAAAVAVVAAAAALALLVILLRDGDGTLEWSRVETEVFAGPGVQDAGAVAAAGEDTTQAIAAGYDRPDDSASGVVWQLGEDGWRRERLLEVGAFNTVATAGPVAAVAGRSGREGSGQGASIWVRRNGTWASACRSACGDVATKLLGSGPRQQEIFGVTALLQFPGSFVAVGADQNTAGDGKYDGAVWVLDAGRPARRIALDEPELRGPLQQQLRAVVDTPQGLVAVGQDGRNAAAWRSVDGGVSWRQLRDEQLRASLDATLMIHALARHGDDLVAVGAQGDARGNNNRAAAWVLRGTSGTWQRASSSDFQPRGQKMLGVAVAPSGELVAVGYDDNLTERRAAVWSSSDGGSWTRRDGVPDDEGQSEANAVALVGAQLVAVGSGGSPGSIDGRVWTAAAPGATGG